MKFKLDTGDYDNYDPLENIKPNPSPNVDLALGFLGYLVEQPLAWEEEISNLLGFIQFYKEYEAYVN